MLRIVVQAVNRRGRYEEYLESTETIEICSLPTLGDPRPVFYADTIREPSERLLHGGSACQRF